VSNQPLIFEISTPGARALDVPPCDVPHVEIDPAVASFTETGLPEVGQLDLVRHYTRLSNRTFCVDANFYPLGSCTMKYNPKVNETLAMLDGLTSIHPMQRDEDCQGALEILHRLRVMLQDVAGLPEVCLAPCAGAHGQWAVLRMIFALLAERGHSQRRTVLVAETAHGTNPASAAAAGATVVGVRNGDDDGLLDVDHLKSQLGLHDVAALMLAQPNTAGKFDPRFGEIVRIVHDAGAMVYLDGANLNAMIGLVRPGDLGVDAMHFGTHLSLGTPHGCGGPGAGPIAVSAELAPYLPTPQVIEELGTFRWAFDRPKSIGRIHGFFGQFGVLVRAYAYLCALGGQGLRNVSETAVLCANYLAQRIRHAYPLPFGPDDGQPMSSSPCAHGFVALPRTLLERGVTTMDVAKALIERGYHPPTVHWPMPDCLTIEPTETESKATLDAFADTLLEIADQAVRDPNALKRAPARAGTPRVDEIAAARKPTLIWKPS
jgi:glycine dehydrogenase subunit 2